MTDIEKKATKSACEYAGLKKPPTEDSGLLTTTDYLTFYDGYIKCAEEYESLPKIRGWVAKGVPDGNLRLYGNDMCYGNWITIPEEVSNDLKKVGSFDEPVEVELLIRKITI